MKEYIKVSLSKQLFTESLVELRDNWSEEIPDRMVHSTDGPWKVRTGWFLSLAANLEVFRDEGFVPNDSLEIVQQYLDWWTKDYKERKSEPDVINTREDIKRGNNVINKVLESLGVTKKT
ncbi:MAG: hypothetical protein UU12_C0007G0017 [Candidatus Woesebacteria bacterium GW2011_GWA2_40_7b]|uniref:Uncharacterized protein n=1 Tax=Candidatus Woesebacteria bacterium GW2011_GWA2_40_7b TaxID=1618563 RepID=A0A0G0T8Q5_9BACT|nr:MAG: hypothetical protein UU12_C0007G0017 [Candidatus Woesebacteria bacterium GW2011_GWA2_40_7b]